MSVYLFTPGDKYLRDGMILFCDSSNLTGELGPGRFLDESHCRQPCNIQRRRSVGLFPLLVFDCRGLPLLTPWVACM